AISAVATASSAAAVVHIGLAPFMFDLPGLSRSVSGLAPTGFPTLSVENSLRRTAAASADGFIIFQGSGFARHGQRGAGAEEEDLPQRTQRYAEGTSCSSFLCVPLRPLR